MTPDGKPETLDEAWANLKVGFAENPDVIRLSRFILGHATLVMVVCTLLTAAAVGLIVWSVATA